MAQMPEQMTYDRAVDVARYQMLAARGAEAEGGQAPELLALLQSDQEIPSLAMTEDPMATIRQSHRRRLQAIVGGFLVVVGVQVWAAQPGPAQAPAVTPDLAERLDGLEENVEFIRDAMRRQLGVEKTTISEDSE